MYAVSDQGGFYSVATPAGSSNVADLATYISSFTYQGKPVQFTGLTNGPPDVENGAYANMLFATDSSGNVWAFNTSGVLQPVFTNGATKVSTGIAGLTGLAFSTLDYNLWHETTTATQNADPGHSINPSPDDVTSRNTAPATTTSYYFGLESSLPDGGAYASASPSVYDTINVPGGAYGSLTTSTFSLANYSTGDDPTLYFDYYLAAAMANGVTDSYRVYISNNGANWTELATDNLAVSNPATTPPTVGELPSYISAEGGTYLGEKANQNMQPLWTNTGYWRQARVDLGDFAGESNLQLMFSFSAAGSMGVGDTKTTGSTIYTVPGNQLYDGDYFAVDNTSFTFNLGTLFDSTDGADIADGSTFTVYNPNHTASQVFEFTKSGEAAAAGDVAIPISNADSADAVAQDILTAIDGVTAPGYTGANSFVNNYRIELVNGTSTASAVTLGSSGLTLESGPVANALNVNFGMSAVQVANILAPAINRSLVTAAGGTVLPGILTAVKQEGALINVINNQITGESQDLVNQVSTSLPGDKTGSVYGAGRNQLLTSNDDGAYLDDIIIGLAGRGEMITSPPAGNTSLESLGNNPKPPFIPITSGPYQLEIQRGSEMAVQSSASMPGITLVQSMNINDRLTQGFSLTAVPGDEIADGQSFSIFDGIHTATYQFTISGSTSNPSFVPIPFTIYDSATTVAASIVNAINNGTSNLNVQAATVGLDANFDSVGDQVNLYGAVQVLSNTTIQVQAGSQIVNGQAITISNGQTSATFEFNSTGVPSQPGNIVILYLTTDTAAQVAAKLAAAINASGLGVPAVASSTSVTVSNATSVEGNYVIAEPGSQLFNGETFTETNSDGSANQFIFVSSLASFTGAAIPVPFTPTDSAMVVAESIAEEAFFYGVNATANGDVVLFTNPITVTGQGVTALATTATSSPGITVYDFNPINGFPLQGDALSPGTQGYTLIDANSIYNSLDDGIQVGPGRGSSRPTPCRDRPATCRRSITPSSCRAFR